MAEISLSFSRLRSIRTKAMRNGGWGKLDRLDKGLYACALELARLRGRITNARLLMQLEAITWRLLATAKTCIFQAGRARAQELLERYTKGGVFDWAPSVEGWLRNREFIFHLGVMELFGR